MTAKVPTNDQKNVCGNVAIYARVATQEKLTQGQKNRQPHDLIRLAHELGYEDSHIFVFEQDSGVSGNTPIDERVGLASLMQEVANGTIQAILIADETLLFRSAEATQLTRFIQVCVEHNAEVITPQISVIPSPLAQYNFSNPIHVKLFRYRCCEAYQFVAEQIMQRTRSNQHGS